MCVSNAVSDNDLHYVLMNDSDIGFVTTVNLTKRLIYFLREKFNVHKLLFLKHFMLLGPINTNTVLKG